MRMCTKTNKRTPCSSKVNITMRSYIPPKLISIRSREPSPLECGCIYIWHTDVQIVTKQQHIQISMCTKTNKRTRCSSKVNKTMCRIFHRNQYPFAVVSEPSPLQCRCIYIHIYSTQMCNSNQCNQATPHPEINVHTVRPKST